MRRDIPLRSGLVVLVVATTLAGCGRKGPLELPPGAPETQAPAASGAQQARVLPPVADPGLIQPPTTPPLQRSATDRLNQQVAAPPPAINGAGAGGGKPFVLDPLL